MTVRDSSVYLPLWRVLVIWCSWIFLSEGIAVSVDNTIIVRRIRTGSVFRIVAAGTFFSIMPFFIFMGVLAAFGMDSLKWNNEPVVGIKGLLVSPFMGLLAAALFTALMGLLMAFGLWFYSKFKPLTLTVVTDGAQSQAP